MFLSHTENAHKDRQEKHQPHVSIITSFNETKLGPSTSESCDKRKTQLVRTNYFTTLCRNIITNLYCHITKYIKIKQISRKQLILSTNNYN